MKGIDRISMALFALALLAGGAFGQTRTPEAKKADPQAHALLQSAQAARESFPKDFAGFKAELTINDNGQIGTGSMDYKPGAEIALDLNGLSEETRNWLARELSSFLSHRNAGDFAKGDGRHPLSLPEDDKSPVGRRVRVNDRMQSSYRVRDGRTSEVDRTMGGERIVVSILETTPTPGGKYLPRHFVANLFDAKTGALTRSDLYTDQFAKVDGVWLPVSRRIITAENGKVTARVIEFRNPQPHKTKEATASR